MARLKLLQAYLPLDTIQTLLTDHRRDAAAQGRKGMPKDPRTLWSLSCPKRCIANTRTSFLYNLRLHLRCSYNSRSSQRSTLQQLRVY